MQATDILKDSFAAVRNFMGQEPADAATAAEVAALDAIDFLKSQHREVEALFKDFSDAGPDAVKTKERLAQTIADKLTVHAHIEETIFYPAARIADEADFVESLEEHDHIKLAISRLSAKSDSRMALDVRVKVLKELVEHHVKEEEQKFFPAVRDRLSEEHLLELGKQLQTLSAKASQPATLKKIPQKPAVATKRMGQLRAASKKTAKKTGRVAAKKTGKTKAVAKTATKAKNKAKAKVSRR